MTPMWIYIIVWTACLSGILAKKESVSIAEDKDVLVLTENNLNHALKQHSQLLVHFYAPLSGESLGSILGFAKAATELKEINSSVKLGKIDISKEKELAKFLNVTTVPSLRLYLDGDKYNPVQCPGLVRHFYDVAGEVADLPFCVTGSEPIFRKYDITDDSVVLLRKSKMAERFEMTSQTVKDDVVHFIRVHEMPLVTEYNGKTSSKILNSVVQNHLLLFIDKAEKGFKQIYRAFKSTAKEYRGKILFVLIDASEPRNGRIMEYFRVRREESPLIRMVNLTDNLQYQLPSDHLDQQTITDFCQSYIQGNAKPKLQSEPIPEDWDKQPVKELVGMNFEKVAFNENKNVLVLFYASWSSESRALFPLFEELAKHYSDSEDVVVAKIDVTANDINIRMTERYPAIKVFPAVYAERNATVLQPIDKETRNDSRLFQIRCFIYNVNLLNCSWSTDSLSENAQYSSVFQFFSIPEHHPFNCVSSSSEKMVECTSRFEVDERKLEMFVLVNISINNCRYIICQYFKLTNIEKLDPPEINATLSKSTNLEIQWMQTKSCCSKQNKCFIYELKINSETVELRNVLTYNLTNFEPTWRYTIQIRTKHSDVCDYNDVWSDWSKAVEISPLENSFQLKASVIAAIVLVLPMILLAFLLICKFQRLFEKLFPPIPNPSKHVQNLLEKSDFNQETPHKQSEEGGEILEVIDYK
ncbi:Protein disulfide-isomerase [Bagarius yarrelli]|uniref:Protein disulfide-isomerase n=1 Tax=Bagarius yarrelli TaxID=175774 RepID=A0A556TKG0_BAGYA|nr:Protein disulfide-isomerase [Bagarius yarrelli]